MSLPCHCHAIAMSLPCHCHVIATSLPCHCHVIAMSLPCHCHDSGKLEPQAHQGHGADCQPTTPTTTTTTPTPISRQRDRCTKNMTWHFCPIAATHHALANAPPQPTAGPAHRQKRCYACPGVAAQEIHRGGAGDAGGALSVGRALAACEDQSTHANAIKIALPTLAEATR